MADVSESVESVEFPQTRPLRLPEIRGQNGLDGRSGILSECDTSLIPGLSEDLSLRCLAMLPCSQHRHLAAVCRMWRTAVSTGLVRGERRGMGRLKPHILTVIEDVKLGQLHLSALEPESMTWHSLRSLPMKLGHIAGGDWSEPAIGFGVAVVGGQVYIIGGMDRLPDCADRCLSSVFRYSLDLDTWEQVSSMHSPRVHFACGVHKGKIVVVGGMYHAGRSQVRDRNPSAEEYDPETDTWRIIPATQIPRMRGPDFGFFQNGRFSVTSEDLAPRGEALDLQSYEWTPLRVPTLPERPIKVAQTPSGPLCVLQTLWPVGIHDFKYTITMRKRDRVHTLGSWLSSELGPMAHPREMIAMGEKLFVFGNSLPRWERKSLSREGPNALHVAEYDLGADSRGEKGAWKHMGKKVFEKGTWILGSGVMGI